MISFGYFLNPASNHCAMNILCRWNGIVWDMPLIPQTSLKGVSVQRALISCATSSKWL